MQLYRYVGPKRIADRVRSEPSGVPIRSPAALAKAKPQVAANLSNAVLAYIKSLWSEPVYQLWRNMERHSLEG